MSDVVWGALIFAGLAAFALIFVGFRHRKELGEKIAFISRIRIGPGGIDISFYEKAVEEKEGRRPARRQSEEILGRINGGRILWVDDTPQNNEPEIAALRERGVEVDCATSNEKALELAAAGAYDLVLSDIDRGSEGEKAGLELPVRLREAGVQAPIAFYVGHADRPATDRGNRVFDTPTELFQYIGEQLGRPREKDATPT
ncbi:MAG TPA: response regulator [Solirubrobacterales bacterium]|nr:response regulator [Solirubrobacterales bacterium]